MEFTIKTETLSFKIQNFSKHGNTVTFSIALVQMVNQNTKNHLRMTCRCDSLCIERSKPRCRSNYFNLYLVLFLFSTSLIYAYSKMLIISDTTITKAMDFKKLQSISVTVNFLLACGLHDALHLPMLTHSRSTTLHTTRLTDCTRWRTYRGWVTKKSWRHLTQSLACNRDPGKKKRNWPYCMCTGVPYLY